MMVAFRFALLTVSSLFFLQAAEATPSRSMRCEGVFKTHDPKQISNIELISKYAVPIARLRTTLESAASVLQHTPGSEKQIGQLIARSIAKEAAGDQPLYWRLFHIALSEPNIPYSAELYEAFLQVAFLDSHALNHDPRINKGVQYAFFRRLADQAFEIAIQREPRKDVADPTSPISYYSKQMWMRGRGAERAETTLHLVWKEKALRYESRTAAEADGRNLAEHIKMHVRNDHVYARFYFLVLSQFKVSYADAFYRGLLDARFIAFHSNTDARTQQFLELGIRAAAKLNGIPLTMPRAKEDQPLIPSREPVDDSVALEQGAVALRALLLRARTPHYVRQRKHEPIMKLISTYARGNPLIFAKLLHIALIENNFYGDGIEKLLADAQSAAAAYALSQHELDIIRDGLKEVAEKAVRQAAQREARAKRQEKDVAPPADTDAVAMALGTKTLSPEQKQSLLNSATELLLRVRKSAGAYKAGEKLAALHGISKSNARPYSAQELVVLTFILTEVKAPFPMFYRGLLGWNIDLRLKNLDPPTRLEIKTALRAAGLR